MSELAIQSILAASLSLNGIAYVILGFAAASYREGDETVEDKALGAFFYWCLDERRYKGKGITYCRWGQGLLVLALLLTVWLVIR